MSNLDTLADDVLLEIVSAIGRKDALELRLVSKKLCLAVEPYALSHLFINIYPENCEDEIEKLQAYAHRITPGADYVRNVTILTLAHKNLDSLSSRKVVLVNIPTPQDMKRRNRVLRELLPQTLRGLGIRTFHWETHIRDPKWAFQAITAWLCERPVHKFSLDFSLGISRSALERALPFGTGKVKHLEVKGIIPGVLVCQPDANELANIIAQLIHHNPALEGLNLALPALNAWNQFSDLGSLAGTLGLGEFLPNTTHPPLQLKLLTLHSISLDTTASIVPHLNSLESLTISWGSVPQTGVRIWEALRTNHIKLKQIRIKPADANAEFFQYLMYCKDTLSTLILDDLDDYSVYTVSCEYGTFAKQFYTEVLPLLAPRLEVLHIRTHTAYAWCFNFGSYAVAFETFKMLKVLSLSFLDTVTASTILENVKRQLSPDLKFQTITDVIDPSSLY